MTTISVRGRGDGNSDQALKTLLRMQFEEVDVEKRFEAFEYDYISIPDTEDFEFSGRPFTVITGARVADMERDHTIVEVKDPNTHLVHFEVIRNG